MTFEQPPQEEKKTEESSGVSPEIVETMMWSTIKKIKNGDFEGAKKDIEKGVVFNDEAKETLGWMNVKANKNGDLKMEEFLGGVLSGNKKEEKPISVSTVEHDLESSTQVEDGKGAKPPELIGQLKEEKVSIEKNKIYKAQFEVIDSREWKVKEIFESYIIVRAGGKITVTEFAGHNKFLVEEGGIVELNCPEKYNNIQRIDRITEAIEERFISESKH